MIQYNKIYEENKILDDLFNDTHPQTDDVIFRKNILGLLVEIGELANETRCFKYWSTKGSSDKEIVLEEYADCLLLIFMFCNYLDISLDETFEEPCFNEINDHFIYLYKLSSDIYNNYNKEYVKKLLSNFIYLGKLLNFSDEDIVSGCLAKINKNKRRVDFNFIN